jgi:hypothetical protein
MHVAYIIPEIEEDANVAMKMIPFTISERV